MIRDLSETLGQVLAKFPSLPAELAAAQIVFDRPSDTFSPGSTTVDLFLYDVRENLELRSNEPVVQRQNGSFVTSRPPLRVACSYLVTAWPVGGVDVALQEHRLLSQVLQVFSSVPTIPPQYLVGLLKGQDPPMPMVTAQADGLRSPGDFWTALGSKIRASVSITVTFAMSSLQPPVKAPMVITEEIRLGERTSADAQAIMPATKGETFRIGGTITEAGNAPVPNATVELVEIGFGTVTDEAGRYGLGWLPAGKYTLKVTPSGGQPQNFSITVPAVSGGIPPNYNVKLA